MKRDLFAILTIIVLITLAFCGCQSSDVRDEYNAIFESDCVKLINYSVVPKEDRKDKIIKVTVDGRIENILDEEVSIEITAEFYDINDDLLGEKNYNIWYLRVKPRNGYQTSFTIVYDEINVEKFDHVKLRAEKFL